MTKLLVIARYHNATMSQKLELLAQQANFTIWLIHPCTWQNELGRSAVTMMGDHIRSIPVRMYGLPSDPHRALYRSLTFSMHKIAPDIIHAEEEPDSLAAIQILLAHRLVAPRAKLIFNTWQNVNRTKTWYVRLVMALALHGCDAITCANSEAIEILRQNGYHRQAVVLPPIGVDTRVYQPASRATQEGFTAGFVGRLVPEKGIDVLIEAMRLVYRDVSSAEMRLLIMGDGPERPNLMKQVDEVGLRDFVTFIQPGSSEKVAEIMHRLDVLVLPSRTTSVWKEQYGRVLIEAMACKVAVIGSDSGAIPEVVGNAGLIFHEGKVAMLKEMLLQLITSPALRQQLAVAGYNRTMSHFTQERIAEKSAEFYRQLTS
jgi:glycosyltransferase involved in cell wall biosynthesis